MSSNTRSVIYSAAGLSDTGDELDDLWWTSFDADRASAEFDARLRRCRDHIENQVGIITSSPGLLFSDPYRYVVAWFKLRSAQNLDDSAAVEALSAIVEALMEEAEDLDDFRRQHLIKGVIGYRDSNSDDASEELSDDDIWQIFGLL